MIKNYTSSNAYNILIKLAKFAAPVLLLLFLVDDTFAQAAQQEFRKDASTTLLSVIFGGVSNSFTSALGGGGSNFVGEAFRVYNVAIMLVGVVVITYITVVALMNSAHSGTPMGKWHSMFLPMRVVIGAGLVATPNAFGYTLAQVLMMWFILTGVDIADNVWDGSTGVLTPAPATGASAAAVSTYTTLPDSQVRNFYDDTARFSICIGMGSTSYPSGTSVTALRCVPFTTNCGSAETIEPADASIRARCGRLRINPPAGGSLSPSVRNNYIQSLMSLVMLPIIDDVRIATDAAGGNPDAIPQSTLTSISNSTWSSMQYAMTITQSAVVQQNTQNIANSPPPTTARSQGIGWIDAGPSYYTFIKGTGGSSANSIEGITSVVGAPSWERNPSANNTSSGGAGYTVNGNTVTASDSGIQNNINSANGNIINGIDNISGGSGGNATGKLKINISRRSNVIMDIISLGIRPLTEWVAKKILDPNALFGYSDSVNLLSKEDILSNMKVEPLKNISKRGSDLTEFIENIFFISLTVLIAGSIAAALIPGLPYFLSAIGVIIPILMGVLSLVLAIVTLFYPIGMIMNVYIPLIPLMIWLFGVIGWLLLCIEAMAAGPLVAVALMHPESNEVLGKAENGLMLILNLMLRPALMVLGLITAVILVRVVLLLFTWGMSTVIETDLIQIRSVGAVVAVLFFYVYMLAVLIQKAFSLINQLPDKLMAWIGSPSGGVGEATEFLQSARQGTETGGGIGPKIPQQGKQGFSSGFKAGSAAVKPNQSGGGGSSSVT